MQTKKQSLIEACTNTCIGFCISFAATYVIFPLVGVATTFNDNLIITAFYTAISIIRSYTIRRWFNKKKPETCHQTELQRLQHQKLLGVADIEAATLYCFDCEIEMPVKYKKGVYYCSNCGLRH